jgi:uncharacterized protein (TIGR00255 family)
MVLSMTGYGTGAAERDEAAVSVEIRTVNHRFLDLHIRLPREYLFLEGTVQQLIRNALDRGRVEVSATILKASSAEYLVNSSMVASYLEAAVKLKNEFDFQDSLDLRTLLTLPGVLKNDDTPQADTSGNISELLKQSVQTALEGVLQMRRREGEALRVDMLRNLAAIDENTQRIRELSVNSAAECLERLNNRLSQLLPQGGMDPQRLAQEAALIADKCDIAEEVARLESHIEQYRALIAAEEKVGKKLDFLLQELQRETNTILSKSANMEVAHHAIAIKTDIEKLREQVQNVE